MDDPIEYPHRFDAFPQASRIRWVEMVHGRVEILNEIARLAEIEGLRERELTPSNARMRKDELAILLLALRDKDRAIDALEREVSRLERRCERLRGDG